jgi:hypothetical protein
LVFGCFLFLKALRLSKGQSGDWRAQVGQSVVVGLGSSPSTPGIKTDQKNPLHIFFRTVNFESKIDDFKEYDSIG